MPTSIWRFGTHTKGIVEESEQKREDKTRTERWDAWIRNSWGLMHRYVWNWKDSCALTEPHCFTSQQIQECGCKLMCQQSFIDLVSYSHCFETTLFFTIENCTDSVLQQSFHDSCLVAIKKYFKYMKIVLLLWKTTLTIHKQQSRMFIVL